MINIKKNNKIVWYTICGDWRSALYPLKIEAEEVKRMLDSGMCSHGKNHEINSTLANINLASK